MLLNSSLVNVRSAFIIGMHVNMSKIAAASILSVLHLLVLPVRTLPDNVVHVVSTDMPLRQCPAEHCYTFNELVEQSDCFNSNTTIILLPGNHIVTTDKSLLIEHVANLLITGTQFQERQVHAVGQALNHRATITCNEAFGITFRNVSNITLSNFTMTGCGVEIPDRVELLDPHYPPEFRLIINATICITQAYNVTIHGIAISDGLGIGLLLYDVYNTLSITYSFFTNNDVNCYYKIGSGDEHDTVSSVLVSNSNFTFGKQAMKHHDIFSSGLAMEVNQDRLQIHITVINTIIQDSYLSESNFNLGLPLDESKVIVYIQGLQTIMTESCGTHGISIDGEAMYMSIVDSVIKGSCIKLTYLLHTVLIKGTYIEGCCNDTSTDILSAHNVILDGITITRSKGLMFRAYTSPKTEHNGIQVSIQGTCLFNNNSGAFLIDRNAKVTFEANSTVEFTENNIICDNEDIYCSPLYYTTTETTSTSPSYNQGHITFLENSHITFRNNTAVQSGGMIVNGSITFGGNCSLTFIRNTGKNGGGMVLGENAKLSTNHAFATFNFTQNQALEKGGAIYVISNYEGICEPNTDITWYFIKNTASLGGSAIFGRYWSILSHNQSPLHICWPQLMHFQNISNDRSTITSDATRICMCINSIPDCSITNYTTKIFPGQTFIIEVVAVGLNFGTVTATARAEFDNEFYSWKIFGGGQYLQHVRNNCTTLSYETIISSVQMKTLTLTTELTEMISNEHDLSRYDTNVQLNFQKLTVRFRIKKCALGFTQNTTSNKCECDKRLLEHGIQCDMTSLYTISFTKGPTVKWVIAVFVHTGTNNESGVVVHDHCPFGYCKTDAEKPSIDLAYPDDQCTVNRSGILCGACQYNLSQGFGTGRCFKCSNHWVLVIIPIFILAGVALVVLLTVLDLTVSIGTINGLIFYANIVRANQAIFFSPKTTNSFLSWFIAWLNLDLGIETCFYNGLDGYVKTWLQFAFPFYIWFIMITIIVLSRRYAKVARLTGNNGVQVLATLFLLSYSKLLRTIIIIFQSTTLTYPDSYQQRVWVYDSNVNYFKGKHIPLFLSALVLLIFLAIPYTAVLIGIQWLQKLKNYRVIFWVHKFKPLFDAYTGPYKENHRYWTGLFLLVRVLLFLVFSLNVTNDPSVNFISIIITIFALALYLSLIGGVYKSKLRNIIEVAFLMNLGSLSVTSLYQIIKGGGQETITHVFVSISLILFVFIIAYHVYLSLVATRRGKRFKSFIKSQLNSKRKIIAQTLRVETENETHVSHSNIQLQESLLAHNVSNMNGTQ